MLDPIVIVLTDRLRSADGAKARADRGSGHSVFGDRSSESRTPQWGTSEGNSAADGGHPPAVFV